MPAESGRWVFVVLGLIMCVCLGAVYAYSIFLGPVREAFVGFPRFRQICLLWFFWRFLPLPCFLAGALMEKLGPRKLGIIGGIIVGSGLAAFQFCVEHLDADIDLRCDCRIGRWSGLWLSRGHGCKVVSG